MQSSHGYLRCEHSIILMYQSRIVLGCYRGSVDCFLKTNPCRIYPVLCKLYSAEVVNDGQLLTVCSTLDSFYFLAFRLNDDFD